MITLTWIDLVTNPHPHPGTRNFSLDALAVLGWSQHTYRSTNSFYFSILLFTKLANARIRCKKKKKSLTSLNDTCKYYLDAVIHFLKKGILLPNLEAFNCSHASESTSGHFVQVYFCRSNSIFILRYLTDLYYPSGKFQLEIVCYH